MGFWIHIARTKHPDRVAIEGQERSVTYSELSALSIDGARALHTIGVRSGDRVALAIDDRTELALALHTCLLAGVPAVPVDLRLGGQERAARVDGAAVVLEHAPSRPDGGLFPLVYGPGMLEMVATVMYTSGTTAAPKQVQLTHGNWLANAVGSAIALGLDPGERWLCAMPLAHVGGLSILIRSLVYATTVVLHERFETESVLNDLMDPGRRITMISLVPTMLAWLLDAGLSEPPALRWALLGGGPIPAALLERAVAAGVPVAPTYGMTEACSQIATFGVPLLGAEIRTEGRGGEILVRGPMVAPKSLDEHGWLRTGDLGSFGADGRLTIAGRKSDTIVSGGENVAPAEVEAVLLAHPDVADAGVFGRSDQEWGEAIVARVVPRAGVALDSEALRVFCGERLAAFKVPKTFEISAWLPRTESGKLLRRELR